MHFSVGMSVVFRITWGCKWDCVSQCQSHTRRRICVCVNRFEQSVSHFWSQIYIKDTFLNKLKHSRHSQYLTVKGGVQVRAYLFIYLFSFIFMDACSAQSKPAAPSPTIPHPLYIFFSLTSGHLAQVREKDKCVAGEWWFWRGGAMHWRGMNGKTLSLICFFSFSLLLSPFPQNVVCASVV